MDNKTNILKWYPFEENKEILEIFNETSILDKLDVKINLSQICIKNKKEIKIEGKYDYITLIGTYSYAPLLTNKENPYIELLKNLKEHIKENGKILIAIDNRLGIKYFSGAKSKYYSRLFEGLESKINPNNPNLLLKSELESFIKDAGFEHYKFYYPLPDYKNTSSIFTDEFLPKSNHSKIIYPLNYEEESNIIFNEINVIKQICDIGQFPNFANSYFIEISNTKNDNDIKFVNYNIFRKDKYQLILTMKNNKFEKNSANDLSKEHIANISRYSNHLKDLGFNMQETVENGKIVSQYVQEQELDKKIVGLILDGDIENVFNEINKWFNYIKERLGLPQIDGQDIFEKYKIEVPIEIKEKMQFVKNGYIDLSFENIFCKDGYLFYDQEWFLENIPLEFILYRAINNLYAYNCTQLEQKITKDQILKKFNLIEFIPYFEILENFIQKDILDDNLIQTYKKKLQKYCYTIEYLKNESEQKTKEIIELQEIYKRIRDDKEKLELEKSNVQEQYGILLNEYNNSRGWKIIRGIRKILGKK